jgi:2-succinyl-5-enolpyruvyl-6-hydroxy-3-cyclohexene-1-carboxylate synthase
MKDFTFSVENDPFFTCYSVVDERSAAYFAMGIAQELSVPVGIVCTSSTATCNYLPGITEAFYQGVPLVVMTGDRDPYLLRQMEDQMIDQVNMYQRVVKKSVTLPIVNNDEDVWYCERIINEALLEINHRGYGPVHINVPVVAHSLPISVKELPEVKVISRISLSDSSEFTLNRLHEKLKELENAPKIMVIAGQSINSSIEKTLELFFERFNCVIYTEHMANLHIKGAVNLTLTVNTLSHNTFNELLPDIVISLGGNIAVYGLKGILRTKKFKHWLINENGDVIDAFKNLTTIFECTISQFFEYFAHHADTDKGTKDYYNSWIDIYKQIQIPELPFSNVSVIQSFLKKMPENSLLHLSILNSIRISNFFELPANTKVYANIGTDGIDGSMSTFLGQSYVSKKLSFLIIGDLSFFYDMNSIRIRHIKNNTRILLINNHGGGEFYNNTPPSQRPVTLDLHIAAKHATSAKGWIESVGFTYLSASTEVELKSHLDEFVKLESEHPIAFEVFTDIAVDADTYKLVHDSNKAILNKDDMVENLKTKIRSVIGDDNYTGLKETVKHILKR